MSALENLDGKVAVVTGGASGIGMGIATQLVRQGMSVVVADIEDVPLQRCARKIGAVPVRADVTDPDSVERLAERTVAEFGAVHLVCNNAGIGSIARVADMTLRDWRWMIDVNLWGVIHGIHSFLPRLKANAEGGHIVNTSSLGGLGTRPAMAGYSVTKFGVVALTETLAQELEEEDSKVGVTVLCPGTVRTNIATSARNRPHELEGGLADFDLEASDAGPLLRWLEPEDIGDIVIRAVKRGDLYAFSHPDMAGSILERHTRIAEAFRDAAAGR